MVQLPEEVEDCIYDMVINGESRASVVSYLKSIGYDKVDETKVSFILERICYHKGVKKVCFKRGGVKGENYERINKVSGYVVFMLLKIGVEKERIPEFYNFYKIEVSPRTIGRRLEEYYRDNDKITKIDFRKVKRKNIPPKDVYNLLENGHSLEEIAEMEIENISTEKNNREDPLKAFKQRIDARRILTQAGEGNFIVYDGISRDETRIDNSELEL